MLERSILASLEISTPNKEPSTRGVTEVEPLDALGAGALPPGWIVGFCDGVVAEGVLREAMIVDMEDEVRCEAAAAVAVVLVAVEVAGALSEPRSTKEQ